MMSGGAELDQLDARARAAARRAEAGDGLAQRAAARAPRAARIGIGVIGFGWLGQAHARSLPRIPMLFARPRRSTRSWWSARTRRRARAEEAVARVRLRRARPPDWRRVIDDPAVDVVVVAAPNMLHVELVEAAAQAGKHVFCEKPVGGTPEQTARAERAARRAGVIGGVGYNYRWAPLVRYAAELIAAGELGALTNYRGRFFSMYGADPLGRAVVALPARRGRLRRHVRPAVARASTSRTSSLGPITRVVGTTATFIRRAPARRRAGALRPRPRRGPDTARSPTRTTPAMLCEFAGGARGTFEASRAIVGPESQMAFDVHGTAGAAGWNLEDAQRAAALPARPTTAARATRRCFGGDRFPLRTAPSCPAARTGSASRTSS